MRAFIGEISSDKEVPSGGSFAAFSEAERELILGKIGEELDEYSSFHLPHPLFISDDTRALRTAPVRTIELGIQDGTMQCWNIRKRL